MKIFDDATIFSLHLSIFRYKYYTSDKLHPGEITTEAGDELRGTSQTLTRTGPNQGKVQHSVIKDDQNSTKRAYTEIENNVINCNYD
jgi:hypothetical protein